MAADAGRHAVLSTTALHTVPLRHATSSPTDAVLRSDTTWSRARPTVHVCLSWTSSTSSMERQRAQPRRRPPRPAHPRRPPLRAHRAHRGSSSQPTSHCHAAPHRSCVNPCVSTKSSSLAGVRRHRPRAHRRARPTRPPRNSRSRSSSRRQLTSRTELSATTTAPSLRAGGVAICVRPASHDIVAFGCAAHPAATVRGLRR